MSKEQILEEIIGQYNIKLLLADGRYTRKHNGIEYPMVNEELVIEAMDTFARASVIAKLEKLKAEISKLRFVTEHPDIRQAYSNMEDLLNREIEEVGK